ncbi:MAG: molybdate ABC transporter substrate-binding protein [Alphaproteobacteria bacterium]
MVAFLSLAGPALAQGGNPLVFAAASLKNALDDANRQYETDTGKKATLSYAASSTLAKQIESGAPAEIFISADRRWMDYLQDRDLVRPNTRHDLLGNSLVLIAPADSPLEPAKAMIGPGLPLAKMLGGGRLAVAEPNSVPAGIYGKAALIKLGVWDSVAGRVAAAENVRAALALVARGEAPLGIVYKTDAAIEPGVKIVGTFPAGTHEPIVYPLALTKAARPEAASFAAYLRGPVARKLFEKYGFTVLDQER